MKNTVLSSVVFLTILLLVPVAASSAVIVAQPPAHANPAAQWNGVWRCQMDGSPNFDLVISDEGRQIAGSILFYLHYRRDINSPWTVKSGLPEPMFNIELHGNTLSFDVSNRRAHPPRTLHDPPLHFVIRLVAPGKAELLNSSKDPSHNLKLTRSDY